MIIPSIDIISGKAVQLRQGKEKVLEIENPLALARDFSRYGDLAVIDLDAALGKGSNFELVKQICSIADCRVGGGIRSIGLAEELLEAGARKLIIGTMASKEFLELLSKNRVIVAIDSRNGMVLRDGWTKDSGISTQNMISELEDYCSGFLFTDVEKDGMMQGCDIELIKGIKQMTNRKLTAAGGITKIREIQALESLGVDSQLGMGIYTGSISLQEAFIAVLDFGKQSGLVPTIVQDKNGQVLMQAFSSKESLSRTFSTGMATYFSRARKSLWTKGESSGNTQSLIKARYDCDRDSLLFTVEQKNSACHTGSYSCFGEREFSIQELYSVILSRKMAPSKSSYTSSIINDEKAILSKLEEEAKEVLSYKNRGNLVWELADLAYFILVLMANKGIDPSEVLYELEKRRR